MERIAIIADDLTGASDSGVQFARKGLRTQVIFDWTAIPEQDFDAIVLDTDSRAIPGAMAYRRAESAARTLKEQGYTWIYKKVDSTLRGNMGYEIDGIMDTFGHEAAFLAPAFPRNGRTTAGGIHSLNGTPVHLTELAQDPRTPVTESEICRILSRQSDKKCANLPLYILREGLDSVSRFIKDGLDEQVKLFVFDAESDEDLKRIAELIPVFQSRVLWAGSAGLAEFLWKPDRADKRVRPAEQSTAPGPVLLIAGSMSSVTRQQVQEVNAQSAVKAIQLLPLAVISDLEERGKEIRRCVGEIEEAIRAGMDISLYVSSSPEQLREIKQKGIKAGFELADVSARIADALGEIGAKAVKTNRIGGLVLTGGDTAKAVCQHLGVHGIELLVEVEPGIPMGVLLGDDRVRTVTKAGAFGTIQSLRLAMDFLRQEGGANTDG